MAAPFSTAASASPESARGSSSSPPWCFSARTVATSTTADGAIPPLRHTMSKNFSIPMSEPKPDSVITYSPSFWPIRSATSDELPCAMFANGPACIRQGWPSSVWIRFGFSASFSSTVIAPAAPRSSAVTGLPPSYEYATVIAPRRARRSCRSRATARIAITSEAAVMSKPLSRG